MLQFGFQHQGLTAVPHGCYRRQHVEAGSEYTALSNKQIRSVLSRIT